MVSSCVEWDVTLWLSQSLEDAAGISPQLKQVEHLSCPQKQADFYFSIKNEYLINFSNWWLFDSTL